MTRGLAVSVNGMFVVYPPALSSTSIAGLSPLLPWEQLEKVKATIPNSS